MTTLEALALQIATDAHEGQTDSEGQPYIEHLLRVANIYFVAPAYRATALLHGVLEHTDITADDLHDLGVPADVVGAVKAITRAPGQDLGSYTDNMMRTPGSMAAKVRFADILESKPWNRDEFEHMSLRLKDIATGHVNLKA